MRAAEGQEVWNQTLQWLLGDDLLVPPVTREGSRSWATYLPAGDWLPGGLWATVANCRRETYDGRHLPLRSPRRGFRRLSCRGAPFGAVRRWWSPARC
ncbi:hypothetical protein [Pseudarthrobacter sp. SSS035]|uniref:hypothetical protein n=1 Tax=Pseudarthrobacter sp. SSS035 TaxID=2931399 RepID=UPI0035313D65